MESAKIVLVENNHDYARTVKDFLELEGFRVAWADNETEGRRILENNEVDLAILDIRLRDDSDENDDSGLQLAKETAPNVPKIILTRFPGIIDLTNPTSR